MKWEQLFIELSSPHNFFMMLQYIVHPNICTRTLDAHKHLHTNLGFTRTFAHEPWVHTNIYTRTLGSHEHLPTTFGSHEHLHTTFGSHEHLPTTFGSHDHLRTNHSSPWTEKSLFFCDWNCKSKYRIAFSAYKIFYTHYYYYDYCWLNFWIQYITKIK